MYDLVIAIYVETSDKRWRLQRRLSRECLRACALMHHAPLHTPYPHWMHRLATRSICSMSGKLKLQCKLSPWVHESHGILWSLMGQWDPWSHASCMRPHEPRAESRELGTASRLGNSGEPSVESRKPRAERWEIKDESRKLRELRDES